MMEKKFSSFYSLYIGLFLLIMLVLPKMIGLLFLGFIPLIFIGWRKKELNFRFGWLQALFVILYFTYAIYSLFSRHSEIAQQYLVYKLSFIFLPLLLAFRPKEKLSLQFPVYGFLIGVAVLLLEGFIGSFQCYLAGKGTFGCFLTTSFSGVHHPSYTSVYYLTALFTLWYARREKIKGISVWVALFGTAILSVATAFCLSLAGILFFFGALAVAFLMWVYGKFGVRTGIAATLAAPIMMYVAVTTIPQISGEWGSAKKFADEYRKDPELFVKSKRYPMSGSEVRLVLWTVSADVFSDYPLGVGTGNYDEVMTQYLNRIGHTELAKKQYNPHNQYLQTGIELGWMGLSVLLLLLIYGVAFSIKYKNWLLLLLVTNLAFNNLFESMLQRQSGVVFYTFALCFLAIHQVKTMKGSDRF